MVHEAVLDYFAQSVWYEPNCVNELAKAQNLAVSQIQYVITPSNTRPSPPSLFSPSLHTQPPAVNVFLAAVRGAAATHHWCAHAHRHTHSK